MIADKKIIFNITEYSLDDVATAHTDIENRKTTGSVILRLNIIKNFIQFSLMFKLYPSHHLM